MLKTGLPQIIELFTIVASLYSAFVGHGKPLIGNPTKFAEVTSNETVLKIAKVFTFVVMLLLGPLLALWGGCRGIYLLLYCTMAFVLYLKGMQELETGKLLVKTKNFYTSALTMAAYNTLLYLGGFWTTN
jgi:hypothetical protein